MVALAILVATLAGLGASHQQHFPSSEAPLLGSNPGDLLGGIAPGIEVVAIAAVADHSAVARASFGRHGIELIDASPGRLLLQGEASSLRSLLASGVLARVATLPTAVPAGLISEGVDLLGVEPWHAAGYAGTGITVAIVDLGFDGYEALLGTELPASVETRSFRLDRRMDLGYRDRPDRHGAAVAEIVHDVAPEASLLLVNIGPTGLEPIVDFLIRRQVDVVNTSIGFLAGPFDGTSPEALEVARAVDAGLTWVTAAGNNAERHWGGPFEDPDGDHWAQVDGAAHINTFRVGPGDLFDVVLTWMGGPDADLDVCLYDTTEGAVQLVCSDMDQTPSDRPVDHIRWRNASPEDKDYGYAVWHRGGSVSRLDVFLSGETFGLRSRTPATSLSVPADVEDVVAVGAVSWPWPAPIETYSSRGPTIDGRTKPDVVAATGVSTAVISPFHGTSASAPHVSGVAAVFHDARPLATPKQMRAFIAARALRADPASHAKDNDYGWGHAHLGDVVALDFSPPSWPEHGQAVVDDLQVHSLTLEWPVAIDEEGLGAYRIHRDNALVAQVEGDTNSYLVAGLGARTHHRYRIEAADPTGNWGPPLAVAATTIDVWTADSRLTASAIGHDSVVLEWSAATDELGIGQYRILHNGQPTGEIAADVTTYRVEGLAPRRVHEFRVDALDGHGVWRPGPALRITTTGPPANVGLVDPAQGSWHLRDHAGRIHEFYFGDPGDTPFAGDWDCDGVDTPGLLRTSDGHAYLRNSNTGGLADISFFVGDPGDVPLAGDFDGDGCDTLSLYRPSNQRFYIINELGNDQGGLGAAEYAFAFGNPGDKPVVGDWDGDGIDEVGLHRESTGYFYFRNTLDVGIADDQFYFGDPGDRFVAGDWGTIDGVETPGCFRPTNTTFYFRWSNAPGVADSEFVWGESGWLPISGVID